MPTPLQDVLTISNMSRNVRKCRDILWNREAVFGPISTDASTLPAKSCRRKIPQIARKDRRITGHIWIMSGNVNKCQHVLTHVNLFNFLTRSNTLRNVNNFYSYTCTVSSSRIEAWMAASNVFSKL